MAYWLLKTEPGTYSFADLVREKTARWDGISNPVALRNVKNARPGDGVALYHTGSEKAAVGLAEIASEPYADPKDPALTVIDVKAGAPLAHPVTLATMKADPAFADSPLVKQGRLSFVPLTDAQWARLLVLSER